MEQLTELQRMLYKELFKKDAYSFCKYFWDEIDSHELKESKIIKFFCEIFQYYSRFWVNYEEIDITLPKIKKGEELIDVRNNKNLLSISMPPRHGKSNFFNILLPTWLFINSPIKVASVSHTQSLAGTMNFKRQQLLNSDKFKFFFPEIKLTQNSAYWIKDNRNGEMYSVPKNAITGFGADILLIDDLVNVAASVRDMKEMESSWITYTETLPSRINDPNKFILINIMQRISCNDIVGRIQKDSKLSKAYNFVTLPAQFSHKTYLVCPISGDIIIFNKGDYLFPEQFGDYSTIKNRITNSAWEAQYLQNPIASDQAIISPDMITIKDLPDTPGIENADIIYSSHDFPVKDKDTSDFLGSVLAYKVGSNLYITDCLEKRLAFVKSVNYVRTLNELYPGICQIIEDKGNGSPILQQLQDEVPGMQAFQPGTASKVQRLESSTLYMTSGNVILVRTEFNKLTMQWELSEAMDNLYNRLLAFPLVEHDDIIDAFSMLILFVFMDKRYAVYGRAFNDQNIIDSSKLELTYNTVFFNKEGDSWKALEIAVQYGEETKLIVQREIQFKAAVEEGMKKLREFAPQKTLFIDCSATEALKGMVTKEVTVERYEIEDFDQSVAQTNLAFSKKLVLLDKSCVFTKGDIENFKFSKSKDENVKYITTKDGFVACIRLSLHYYGGII